jgi:hypothetical protein
MALYKYTAYVKTSTSDAFDKEYSPGATTPYSGIYRCQGCGNEIASNVGNPLPPENNHQHANSQIKIRWRMIVQAQ